MLYQLLNFLFFGGLIMAVIYGLIRAIAYQSNRASRARIVRRIHSPNRTDHGGSRGYKR